MDMLTFLENNEEIQSLLHQVNKVMINRMDYNDHGPVHSRIVAENSIKLLHNLNLTPNIVKEGIGDITDAENAIILGAYLHDVGNSINRTNHEVHGLMLALPIIDRVLNEFYNNKNKIMKLKTVVSEIILTHECNYIPTSVEAKIVAVADATDMAKGRARIAFRQGDKDIHEFSAMAIEKVELKGNEIHVFMNNPAGVFQVDMHLMKRIKATGLNIKVIIHLDGKEIIKH